MKKTFYCGICEETVEHDVEDDDVFEGIAAAMEHFRVLHPETYAEVDRWPDGAPVVIDKTLEAGNFAVANLYEQSGGDTTRCEFCGDPLDDSRPWRRGLDGAGAHDDCIPTVT